MTDASCRRGYKPTGWCPHPRGWVWHAADVAWTCWVLRGVLVGEVRGAIKERWTRKMEVGR